MSERRPSLKALAGHHLSEAIRHLRSAASFVRKTDQAKREKRELLLHHIEASEGIANDVLATIEKEGL